MRTRAEPGGSLMRGVTPSSFPFHHCPKARQLPWNEGSGAADPGRRPGQQRPPREIVQYSVYLEYADNEATSVPSHAYMEADGGRGFRLDRYFPNPDQAAQLFRRRDGIE